MRGNVILNCQYQFNKQYQSTLRCIVIESVLFLTLLLGLCTLCLDDITNDSQGSCTDRYKRVVNQETTGKFWWHDAMHQLCQTKYFKTRQCNIRFSIVLIVIQFHNHTPLFCTLCSSSISQAICHRTPKALQCIMSPGRDTSF